MDGKRNAISSEFLFKMLIRVGEKERIKENKRKEKDNLKHIY